MSRMDLGIRRLFSMRTLLASTLLFAVFFLQSAPVAEAGFGITPPYVQNSRLTRGTVYEQKITLVRSDPNVDLKTEITMNIPGIESWFSIDRGNEFILPAGTTQMPIIVTVRVPEDAEYKKYKGAIRIRTSAAGIPEGGGVSIALGAQVDVDIEVVDKILDFDVRRIKIADLEEGRRKWGLFFPAKIRFFMTVENTGNEDFGPTKVQFDIYDSEMETLLETTKNTNSIEKIDPFAIKEVLAELPTRLPAGRYTAKYTIYKNDDVAQQSQVNLSISTLGSVPGYEGYALAGLALVDKLKVAVVLGGPILLMMLLVAVLTLRRKKHRRSRHRAAA